MEHTRRTSSFPVFRLIITFNLITLKSTIQTAITAASTSILFFACKPDIDTPAAGKGSLNLDKYVAIGSAMTAGYADNALYRKAQETSYPNLIAQQLKPAGGGDFK